MFCVLAYMRQGLTHTGIHRIINIMVCVFVANCSIPVLSGRYVVNRINHFSILSFDLRDWVQHSHTWPTLVGLCIPTPSSVFSATEENT